MDVVEELSLLGRGADVAPHQAFHVKGSPANAEHHHQYTCNDRLIDDKQMKAHTHTHFSQRICHSKYRRVTDKTRLKNEPKWHLHSILVTCRLRLLSFCLFGVEMLPGPKVRLVSTVAITLSLCRCKPISR